MSRGIGRILGRRTGSAGAPGAIRGPSSLTLADLARRIEEVGNVGARHAEAYVDHRLATLRSAPDDSGRRIEARALLASQEAKAYADSSIGSLSMALRGMSRVVLRLSRRVDQIEGQSGDAVGRGPNGDAAVAPDRGIDRRDTDTMTDLKADLLRIEAMVEDVAGRLADLERRQGTANPQASSGQRSNES
ncbi:hypothetical protein TPR58_19070 [Sphingomonas sp. HF-S3]|uniref:Uncharacterized protein n=1 Tax=Sphingomonas rustica TaxID=3103142 RepID=A0ABV0BCK7_9SPHN